MKQQTAVEWMIKEIESLITIETFEKWKAIKEQAKAMNWEQIDDAYVAGLFDGGVDDVDNRVHAQYYIETYGK
jgi:hypothetical protein